MDYAKEIYNDKVIYYNAVKSINPMKTIANIFKFEEINKRYFYD